MRLVMRRMPWVRHWRGFRSGVVSRAPVRLVSFWWQSWRDCGLEFQGRFVYCFDMTAGRPTLFSPEIAETIYQRVLGGRSLMAVCEDRDMPSIVSVWRWRQKDENFEKLITEALKAKAILSVEHAVSLADESTLEDVPLTKLQIDTRLRVAKMICPELYSDRVEHTGAGGKPLIPQDNDIAKLSKILAYFFSAGLVARNNQGADDGQTVEQLTIEASDNLPDT